MNRNFRALETGPFDLLVIGGGIYGAWTAYDAALRGLRVAIVEKGDWASGTSSASSKLLHGGLRYLEQLHFGLVRKSLDERRRLFKLARHHVTPLRFVIPLYRGGRVGRFRLRTGLWIYDALAGGDQPVARHTSMDLRETHEHCAFLSTDGLTGALTYGDCQIDDARFVVEVVDGAVSAGAVAVNYATATGLLRKNGRVLGARVTDEVDAVEVDVHATVTVNAAGPWADGVSDGGRDGRVRLSKGVHLVLPALPTEDAMLIMARRDRRVFFIIPWYGRTLLGTTDSDYRGDLDNVAVEEADVDYLLGEANRVLETPWTPSMILGRFAGVRALKYEPDKTPDAVTREWLLQTPHEGLLVSRGGKYTSARADASEIVDRVTAILGMGRGRPEPTAGRPTPWSPDGDFARWRDEQIARAMQLGFDSDTAAQCTSYGTRMDEVLAFAETEPALAGRINHELPFAAAEVLWAAEYGMAATLEDIVRRRMPLVVLLRADRSLLGRIADLASRALGWDANQRREQVENVLNRWGTPAPIR